jgi:hypothetical protein
MSSKVFLAAALGLLFAACGPSGLNPLVLDGHGLHASLVTQQIDDVPRAVLRDNPQLSTEPEFVEVVARGGSQGQLGGEGIRAAFYAVYRGRSEVGRYGLEASSTANANRLEGLLREIWTTNASLDRARIHRGGEILVVVWNHPVSPSCWKAVNTVVAERLVAP